jgi:hypothetical protein
VLQVHACCKHDKIIGDEVTRVGLSNVKVITELVYEINWETQH